MIQLIAVDVDGTLLTDKQLLTSQTIKALKCAIKNGIKIVLCTGRPTEGVRQIIQALGMHDGVVVSFNGAVIEDLATQTILFRQSLTLEDLLLISRLSDKLALDYHIQSLEGIYATKPIISPYTAYDSWLNRLPITVKSLAEFKQTPIDKILFVAEPSRLEACVRAIPACFFKQFNLVRSLDCFFEFLNKRASKGLALKQVAELYGIEQENIIAIGDNENDLSMLAYAGISVAMGNASHKVKVAASLTTKTNNEDGVAWVLKYLKII